MINTIFITSLSQEDKKIFHIDSIEIKIKEELKNINILESYNVNNANNFKEKLKEILNFKINGNLFLQINLHGYNDFSGIAFIDGSGLKWNDFDNLLRELNKKLNGKLYLIMAVCYGLHLKRIISNYSYDLKTNRNSPFRGIFASKTPVYNYEFNNLYSFYELLSETSNIEKGIEAYKIKVPNSKMEYQDLYLGAIEFINSKSSINLPVFDSSPEIKKVMKEQLINNLKKYFLILS